MKFPASDTVSIADVMCEVEPALFATIDNQSRLSFPAIVSKRGHMEFHGIYIAGEFKWRR